MTAYRNFFYNFLNNHNNVFDLAVSSFYDKETDTIFDKRFSVRTNYIYSAIDKEGTVDLMDHVSPVWIGMNGRIKVYESVPGHRTIRTKSSLGSRHKPIVSSIPVPYIFYVTTNYPNNVQLDIHGSLEPFRDIRQPVFSLPLSNIGRLNAVCLGDRYYEMNQLVPRFWNGNFNGDLRSTQKIIMTYLASSLFWTSKEKPRKVLLDNLNEKAIAIIKDYRTHAVWCYEHPETFDNRTYKESLVDFWGKRILDANWSSWYADHFYASAFMDSISLEEMTNPILWDPISSQGVMLYRIFQSIPYVSSVLNSQYYIGKLKHYGGINNLFDTESGVLQRDAKDLRKVMAERHKEEEFLGSVDLQELESLNEICNEQLLLNALNHASTPYVATQRLQSKTKIKTARNAQA